MFLFDRSNLNAMVSMPLIGDMVLTNGPVGRPLHPVMRRAMGSLTLVNISFYTEAFITMFSLADDQIQEVLNAGTINQGLSKTQRKKKLVIDEDRLERYLTTLLQECGWQSLKAADSSLYENVMEANTSEITSCTAKPALS
jgi:hypothetical protein